VAEGAGVEPRQLLLRHASQSSLDESSQKIGGKVRIIREMESIGSTFRKFCHCPQRGVDAGRVSCKTTEYKCNELRESRSVDSQNIPCATLKRRGSWVISIYLW